jgi:hypothetical protein
MINSYISVVDKVLNDELSDTRPNGVQPGGQRLMS